MQETWVQFLAQEDPLEEMATTPVFLPGKSHGQRIPGGLRGVTGSDIHAQMQIRLELQSQPALWAQPRALLDLTAAP